MSTGGTISQEIWLAVVGFLFTVIQSLVGLVVGYLILEIRKLNKVVSDTAKELSEIRINMWSEQRLDNFFELRIHEHKDNCSRCSFDCVNYKSYKEKRKEKEE